MNFKNGHRSNSQNICSKRSLLSVISLLFAVALVFSPFVSVFNVVSPFASGAADIVVSNETELRNAVNAATGPTTITLNADIFLTRSLIIPTNKNITLTSNGDDFFKLISTADKATIFVEDQGLLILNGIAVTHTTGAMGCGVQINSGGTLMMFGGEISGNTANYGGGVVSSGSFEMFDGVIANNTATQSSGGGVVNSGGNFRLYAGVITNNTATQYIGGGVVSSGSFEMFDGVIANNTALIGGGVANFEIFSLFGGEISGNIAGVGGGIYNCATFHLSGGKISDNSASHSGGGVYNVFIDLSPGNFELSGGVIANNTASNGGGVLNAGGFVMSGGEIIDNNGTSGGGVYVENGIFNLLGGKISGNRASANGGGIWITDTTTNLNRLIVANNAEFSNNYASKAYNRDPSHNMIYTTQIGEQVIWSEPFTQGYNNYDISYVSGAPVYPLIVHGSYVTPTGAGSYLAGASVTIYAGARDGHTFSGWTVTSGGVSLSNSASVTFTMPANNVVVTANWTPVSSGGSGGGSGGSSNKPSPSTPNLSDPVPSETAPPSGDNVLPSPNDKEISSWSLTTVALIVVTIILAITVVTNVLLWQKLKTTAQPNCR